MTDNHRIRQLLLTTPRLTAEEIGEALGWTDTKVRNVLSGLVHRGEGFSLPKRYELTPLGESRVRNGGRTTLTDEQRRQKSLERMTAFRERQKAQKEAERQSKQLLQEEEERAAALAANDGLVAQAIASRTPLAMVWGGAHA